MKTEHQLQVMLERLDSLDKRMLSLAEALADRGPVLTPVDVQRFTIINYFMQSAIPMLHWILETSEAEQIKEQGTITATFKGVTSEYVGIDDYAAKLDAYIDEVYSRI